MAINTDYRFVVTDIADAEQEEIEAFNPTWSYVLNDAGACSFTMMSVKVKRGLFVLGKTGLHIYRGSVLVWGGYLYNAQSTAYGEVRFGWEGYFSRLKRRYIDATKNYPNTEQLDIAWGLINFTQSKTNGNTGMGWTRASATPSGQTRDLNYPFWERAIIADAITDLSTMAHGFDFEVTPDQQWTTYYPSKGTVRTLPMELGKNIQTFALTEDATDTANTVTAIGSGDGKNTCIAVGISAANQASYGLLEVAESYTNIRRFAMLQDRADERVRMLKSTRIQPSVTVVANQLEPTSYQWAVGDRVTVVADDGGYVDFNQQMRIISVVFALSNEGREAITMQFDDQVDV